MLIDYSTSMKSFGMNWFMHYIGSLVIENRFAIIISFVKNEFQINEWLYLLLSTNNLLTHSETPVTNVQSSKTATRKNVYPLMHQEIVVFFEDNN